MVIEKSTMDSKSNERKGFVSKFAGSFTCHSMSLKKDKKRPIIDISSPETDSTGPLTGLKRIASESKRGLPFVDILKPTKKDDLLVATKKTNEIEKWLNTVLSKRPESPPLFMILSGPSGSGKLTAIKLIAQERGIDVIEYIEVDFLKSIFNEEEGSYGDQVNNRAQSSNLQNFLVQSNSNSLFCKKLKSQRLIVIKELPTTLIREPEKYHKLWTWYYSEYKDDGVPVVFIINNDPGREQIKLFSSLLKTQLNVAEITLNPIVKRDIVKWLVEKLEKKLSKEDIESIVDDGRGDIRNVINALELKFSQELDRKLTYSSHKRLNKKKKIDPTSMANEDVSSTISGRDQCLEKYHFFGKILYSKRHFDEPLSKTLPPELRQYERHSLHEDPYTLYDSYEMSSESLLLYLHQNYLNFSENLECAANCVDWLSQADCLRDEVYDSNSPLQQYQSCLAVAGLMFNSSPSEPIKVKNFDDNCNKKKTYGSKTVSILSARDYYANQDKVKDAKRNLEDLTKKFTSIFAQNILLDILPYFSSMGRKKNGKSHEQFTSNLTKMAIFPKITNGCFSGNKEPFSGRQSTIQFSHEDQTLKLGEDDNVETDDEGLYTIEDDSN